MLHMIVMYIQTHLILSFQHVQMFFFLINNLFIYIYTKIKQGRQIQYVYINFTYHVKINQITVQYYTKAQSTLGYDIFTSLVIPYKLSNSDKPY